MGAILADIGALLFCSEVSFLFSPLVTLRRSFPQFSILQEFSLPNTSVLGSDQDPCLLQATTSNSDGCGWRLFLIIHTLS